MFQIIQQVYDFLLGVADNEIPSLLSSFFSIIPHYHTKPWEMLQTARNLFSWFSRKSLKIVVIRYQILKLKCTEFPSGEAYSAPPDSVAGGEGQRVPFPNSLNPRSSGFIDRFDSMTHGPIFTLSRD